jgi:hypothetical protein
MNYCEFPILRYKNDDAKCWEDQCGKPACEKLNGYWLCANHLDMILQWDALQEMSRKYGEDEDL